MEKRKITELIPHNRNNAIYNKMDVSDIENSIRQYGFLPDYPIVINKDGVILSGHRRFVSAQKLGIEEVPVIVKEFEHQWQELEFLLISNAQRNKTVGDRVREGWEYEKIEKVKARERQATSTGGANPQLRDNCPQAEESGKTREIVSSKIGMNYKSYERASKVLKDLYAWFDEDDNFTTCTDGNDFEPGIEEDSDYEKIDFYDAVLSQSISGAKRAYESHLYEDLKKHGNQNLIDKMISGDVKLKQLEERASDEYNKAVFRDRVMTEYNTATGSNEEEKQANFQKVDIEPENQYYEEDEEDDDYEDDEDEFMPPDYYPDESVADDYDDFDPRDYATAEWSEAIKIQMELESRIKRIMKYYEYVPTKMSDQFFASNARTGQFHPHWDSLRLKHEDEIFNPSDEIDDEEFDDFVDKLYGDDE